MDIVLFYLLLFILFCFLLTMIPMRDNVDSDNFVIAIYELFKLFFSEIKVAKNNNIAL